VNPDLLSDYARQFYGKSPFEQDLVILRSRAERSSFQARRYCDSIDGPPPLYYRAEYTRLRQLEAVELPAAPPAPRRSRRVSQIEKPREEEQHLEEEQVAPVNVAPAIQSRFGSFVSEPDDAEPAVRESAPDGKPADGEESEMSAKIAIPEKSRFPAGRATRASLLKFVGARRTCEKWRIESERQKVNDDLRRTKEKEVSARLKKVVAQLNPDVPTERTLQIRKDQIREGSIAWDGWLQSKGKALEQKGTMIGRLFFTSLRF
jgi:hypothetical protein